MKIIFLDVDGVCNSGDFLWTDEHHALDQSDEQNWFDPAAVARLNRIIEVTGAVCVLSSTWRILHRLPEVRGFLSKAGFTGDLVDYTPGGGGPRGPQIRAWLDETKELGRWEVKSFVILDDDSDMGDLMPRLVQTSFQHGLQDEHVEAAIAMLNEVA